MKKLSLGIAVLALGITCLAGCSKEEIVPTQTEQSIEAIQPTEIVEIETEPEKETSEALIIDSVPYNTSPKDVIKITGQDENGNMMVEVEDVEVDTDGKLTVKKYEGYKDENDEMHLEEVVTDSSGTESENNESSLSEYIVQDDSELPTETLSIDEVNQLQQDTLDGMDAILHQDTIDMMRMSVKTDVKNLVEEGNTEFEGITDEMIDNMSEEELSILNIKCVKAIRGY